MQRECSLGMCIFPINKIEFELLNELLRIQLFLLFLLKAKLGYIKDEIQISDLYGFTGLEFFQ